MPLSNIKFVDATVITFNKADGNIHIKNNEIESSANIHGKQIFTNDTGESVIELSGLSSEDKRTDQSWALAFYEKNGYSLPHFHTERTEIYYVISGTAKVIIDGEERILNSGEEITIHPMQQHQVTSIDDNNNLEMIVKCSPSWIFEDQHFVTPNPRPSM